MVFERMLGPELLCLIFESHGEQIIKDITVTNMFNQEKWTPKVNDEFKHEDEISAPCIVEEVKKVK